MKRRAFVLWAIIALLWANLPYLIGYASSTPANRFGGFFLYEQDGYSYLAKMRQGAQGAWEFHLPYTSEDEYQTGGLALMFYIVVGKLAALGLDDQLIYHGSRLLGSLLLLFVLNRFLIRFIHDRRWQMTTWWLLLFSGGWGLLFSTLIDARYVAYELIAPDAHLFTILYGPPHVIFGFALLLIWIGYTLNSFQTDRAQLPRRLWIANLLGGITALSREAYGPVFAGLFAAYLVALTVQRRKVPWRESLIVALSSIGAGVYGVYMLIAYRTLPGFIAWYQQNPFESPNVIDFALGFAPLILLAVPGLWLSRRPSSFIPHPSSFSPRSSSFIPSLRSGQALHPSSFILAWLIAAPIMAYLPIEISRRLIVGWQIPLSIFSACGLLRLWRTRRVSAVVALIMVLPTTCLVIVGGATRVTAQPSSLYQSADELAALNWLGAHTTDRDVVLSDWHFGNLVPIYADARVFIGHPIETIDYKNKLAWANQFFDTADSAQRRDFVQRWHITLIAAETDRVLNDYPIAFQSGRYTLYRASP